MALAVLMILFALCSLILSFSMMQVNNLDKADDRMKTRNALDQIGESFCASVAKGDAWSLENDREYTAATAVDGTTTTLTVTNRKGDVVFTVELEKSGSDYIVTQWSYQ